MQAKKKFYGGVAVLTGLSLLYALVPAAHGNEKEDGARPERPRQERRERPGRPEDGRRGENAERLVRERQRNAERPDGGRHDETRRMHERFREEWRERNAGFLAGLKDKTPQEICGALLEHRNANFEASVEFRRQMHQRRMQAWEQHAGDTKQAAERRAAMEARYNEMVGQHRQRHAEFTQKLKSLSQREDLTHADLREFMREHRIGQGDDAGTRPGRLRPQPRDQGAEDKQDI